MANIKKSYNFRNGVQVDNDNFIVTSSGLVGIGTSVPSESLDVQGNIKSSGFITASQINAQNINISNSGAFQRINVGIVSITSGIITSSTGTLTYYGNGQFLQNLPTSQWLDVDPGLGFTSIYSQGFVGIATTMPVFALQIGGNGQTSLPSFQRGVGISSYGDVLIAGITSTNSIFARDVNISGVATGTFSGIGSQLTVLNASSLGIGTIPNERFSQNVVISGIVTATTFIGNLTGVASTANSLTTTANVTTNSLTANNLIANTNIGIGTNSTSSDLHIRRTNAARIQVTSDTNEARVVIGRNVTITQNNAQIRFGNVDGAYTYSNSASLDILNFDTGGFNYYLNVNGGTSNWNWIYGSSNLRMRLTYDGKLGLGTTNPNETLSVVGTSTVTSNSWVGGNLSISGSTTANVINSSTLYASNKLGISTSSTVHDFQLNGDPNSGQQGVTISDTGNVNISGILTSNYFSSLSGNISGILTAGSFSGGGSGLTNLNASNLISGQVDNQRLPTNLNISGIVTAGSFSGIGASITNINASNITSGQFATQRLPNSINISGISTSDSGLSTGNGTIEISISGSNLTFTNIANGQSVTLVLS